MRRAHWIIMAVFCMGVVYATAWRTAGIIADRIADGATICTDYTLNAEARVRADVHSAAASAKLRDDALARELKRLGRALAIMEMRASGLRTAWVVDVAQGDGP